MKTVREMQDFITRLGQKHGVDFSIPGAQFRFDLKSWDPLCVQRLDKHHVSVLSLYDEELDLEVIFFTGYPEWVPVATRTIERGLRRYAVSSEESGAIESCEPVQPALADFCRTWAQFFEDVGYLKRSKRKW